MLQSAEIQNYNYTVPRRFLTSRIRSLLTWRGLALVAFCENAVLFQLFIRADVKTRDTTPAYVEISP